MQYSVEENADGSKTVWVGELEVRQRMRWAVGYTLRPGKAYFEASVRILNRTPVVNTMLCFANVAVHANDNYQVIFPPATQYGTGHGKHTFTQWPVSDTIRGGADMDQEIDISWYKNHVSSNSVFAWNYSDDFVAGYDHGKQAGTLILDESGRLKYHVRNRIRSAERQNPRLDYLWTHGGFSGGKAFALLHLERVLRGDVTGEAEAPSREEDHAG